MSTEIELFSEPIPFGKLGEDEGCKGIVWRGKVSSYVSSHGTIEQRASMRMLKRKSCPGCEHCGWELEYIQEDISNNPPENYLQGIEDGKLYRYVIHTDLDRETGQHEVDYSEFTEIKEEL